MQATFPENVVFAGERVALLEPCGPKCCYSDERTLFALCAVALFSAEKRCQRTVFLGPTDHGECVSDYTRRWWEDCGLWDSAAK